MATLTSGGAASSMIDRSLVHWIVRYACFARIVFDNCGGRLLERGEEVEHLMLESADIDKGGLTEKVVGLARLYWTSNRVYLNSVVLLYRPYYVEFLSRINVIIHFKSILWYIINLVSSIDS